MQSSGGSPPTVGYLRLLRTNRSFRLLWYGQLVSQLGDWFDSIALFALLLRLTGSGTVVSLVLIAQFLPLMTSLSSFGIGRAHDAGYSPRLLALVVAALFTVASIPLWSLWRRAALRPATHVDAPEPVPGA